MQQSHLRGALSNRNAGASTTPIVPAQRALRLSRPTVTPPPARWIQAEGAAEKLYRAAGEAAIPWQWPDPGDLRCRAGAWREGPHPGSAEAATAAAQGDAAVQQALHALTRTGPVKRDNDAR